MPGQKKQLGTLNQAIVCGGVQVSPGDMVVADEEGTAVIPAAQQTAVWQEAKQGSDADATQPLTDWEASHRARVEQLVQSLTVKDEG